MTTHAQNLRAFAAWSEVVGLREGDRYLVVNPVLPRLRLQGGLARLRCCAARPCCRTRSSTCPPCSSAWAASGSRCCRARRRCTSRSSRTRIARRYDLSSLRLAVTGAAAIPVELIHRMRGELGFETIITGYGLTECCGIVSMCRFDDDPETIATTSGRAIPDIEVRCVDAEGKEVPRGEPGEVVVRGYNVMQGYFEDEDETRKTIDAEGWLHTGDVAVMDERGYLRITDRIKDMFIIGGFNCYPAEIENLLFAHGGRRAGGRDRRSPTSAWARWAWRSSCRAPGATLTPASVIAWCREQMANYKVPRARRDRGRAAAERLGQGDEVRAAGPLHAPALIRSVLEQALGGGGRNLGSGLAARANSGEREVDDRVDQRGLSLPPLKKSRTAIGPTIRSTARSRSRSRGSSPRSTARSSARTSGRRRSRSTGSSSFESAWLWRRSPARLGSTVPSGVELKSSK